MTFPILGGNGAVATYQIDNSLRFNDGDSPRLDRTSVSSPTDSKIFTYSVWLKKTSIGSNFTILDARSGTNRSQILFRSGSNEAIRIAETSNNFSSFDTLITTNALYRDVSAWYHLLIKYDSTNGTANNRCLIYVNGVEQSLDINTSVTLNYTTPLNEGNYTNDLGHADGAEPFDGYIAEAHFIDGQALSPTDFGEFDEDSGIWKPIEYTGTYGTNGFYLDFEDSGSLGADQSGNSNNFTPTNLASTDQTTDTPTNNFATLNANLPDSGYNTSELSEGNLIYNVSEGNNGNGQPTGNMPVTSGKWYWEIKFTSAQNSRAIGLCRADKVSQETVQLGGTSLSQTNATISLNLQDQQIIQKDENGSTTTEGSSLGSISNGDIFGHFLDLDNGTFQFYKNGSAYGSQFGLDNLSSWNTHGALPTATGFTFMRWDFNFGNPPFSISSGNSDANGYGNFEYSPNDGTYDYLALCTQNLATELSPTIDDGSQYFNTVLWSGNSVDDRSITGVGFAPDLVSIKSRNLSTNFYWYDTTRGADKQIISNATNAEQTITNKLQAFESDGFQLGTSVEVNGSSYTYAGWSWKANGGTTSSNTDGSITSTVQANTTAGFSIITYTGTGASGSVGHGLTKAPEMVICKQRTDAGTAWQTGHTGLTNWTYKLLLNDTVAESVNANVFPSAPTSTVINLGLAGDSNGSGKSQLIYAFHSVEGHSKMGSYTGNGSSTDGTYIHLGFRPAFVMVKATSRTGDWIMEDATRSTFNPVDDYLRANGSNAEVVGTSSAIIDFLSNGFKCRANGFVINESSASYIYYAVAESPFCTSTGIPVTAR